MDNGGGSKPLKELEKRLNEARGANPEHAGNAPGRNLGVAFRLMVELVVGVMVGVGIGWALDRWLGTSPVFLIIFFLMGSAAGMLNVIRAARDMGLMTAEDPAKNHGPAGNTDEKVE